MTACRWLYYAHNLSTKTSCKLICCYCGNKWNENETPVTLEAEWARMGSEWKFVVPSWIFEVYSKNSDCILSAFQIFGPILVTGLNVFIMLKNIRGAFEVGKYRTAIELHSDCILNILTGRYGIPTTFETFWSPSKENRNGKPLQILPECPECASNEPECTSNAFRLLPESISILQEFSSNAIQMSESFDCRSNAARIQSERPDWPSNESGRNSEHRRIAYLYRNI